MPAGWKRIAPHVASAAGSGRQAMHGVARTSASSDAAGMAQDWLGLGAGLRGRLDFGGERQ
jgi:hypothetical protein